MATVIKQGKKMKTLVSKIDLSDFTSQVNWIVNNTKFEKEYDDCVEFCYRGHLNKGMLNNVFFTEKNKWDRVSEGGQGVAHSRTVSIEKTGQYSLVIVHWTRTNEVYASIHVSK